MAARKLQQEVDKCFKKVDEGVVEFERIYEKIEQSNNQSQKEKLENDLKTQIKKLQRLRDQIKTWAASNDVKDKAPLLEHRKLIETQMEKFKAVEKAMKTKAYSKEGLSAAAKLDPKEQAKMECSEFLSEMVAQLEEQVEQLEVDIEKEQPTAKKGKKAQAAADLVATKEAFIESHKRHIAKLELIRRSMENGGVQPEAVNALEETIRYYVTDGTTEDYIEDEGMYDDLDLNEEEDAFGMAGENDKGSSQDNQSVQEEAPEQEPRPPSVPKASRTVVEAGAAAATATGRRPSAQLKSPLPTLATLHNPLANVTNGTAAAAGMKPATLPTRPAGEGLKYASAAAAAAASDKNNLGLTPLPPPPGLQPAGPSPLPPVQQPLKTNATSATSSPSVASIQPAPSETRSTNTSAPPAPSVQETRSAEPSTAPSSAAPTPATRKAEKATSKALGKAAVSTATPEPSKVQTNGVPNGFKAPAQEQEEESIYHLPASLQDLVESFEITKKRPAPHVNTPSHLRMMHASQASMPDALDADAPKTYRPDVRYPSNLTYPQNPLEILNDPRLYARIDPDTLFYVFYYKQGTYQQYLAAKALKDQSWRFHKQYQTWFQRHEEPKAITEEFEQGTYRFFDYESTWMNRRKADFKFVYRFLEDDVA